MLTRFIDRHQRWLFPAPAVIFVLLMMIFPLSFTLWNSFSGWSLTAGRPNTFIGPQNYFAILADARFWNAVWNTLYFTALAMSVELVLGVAIALLLDFKDYPGKRIVTSILLLPMMATPVAVAMVWLLMFEPTAGVINFVLDEMGLPEPLWIAGSNSVIPSLAPVWAAVSTTTSSPVVLRSSRSDPRSTRRQSHRRPASPPVKECAPRPAPSPAAAG